MKKIKYALDYFKYLNNPLEALKFKFGFKKSIKLQVKKSSNPITLNNIPSINKLMNLIPLVQIEKLDEFLKYIEDIDHDKKYLQINDLFFINIHNSNFIKNNKHTYGIHLEEFFTDDEWNKLNFKNRHVIDIGGNIGDTPLYFAIKGARVISFEPVKHLHELAIENVKINNKYSDRITLVNKGVGSKEGKLTFESNSVKGYIDNTSYEMEITTIKNILDTYEFTPDILKMDCEGCEFEIILNEDLTMFNEIIFEHHSKSTGKDYKPLIDKLKKDGFKIDTYEVSASKLPFEDIGIIHAYK